MNAADEYPEKTEEGADWKARAPGEVRVGLLGSRQLALVARRNLSSRHHLPRQAQPRVRTAN